MIKSTRKRTFDLVKPEKTPRAYDWAVTKAAQFLGKYHDACFTADINELQQGLKVKIAVTKLKELIEAADEACDWLCESHPGSDQRERGNKLRRALKAISESENEATTVLRDAGGNEYNLRFSNWKVAADYCNTVNRSNEDIRYDPQTNTYLLSERQKA